MDSPIPRMKAADPGLIRLAIWEGNRSLSDMGKLARHAAILLNGVAMLSGGLSADSSDAVEKGDELARGQRAMAFVGVFVLMIASISAPIAYDIFIRPFLTPVILTSFLSAGIIVPFVTFILVDRRISRSERARAEATFQPKAGS